MSTQQIIYPPEGAALTEEQSQRAECLRLAAELATVATLDDRWALAQWLYAGTEGGGT